jgi:hypothetical protein
MADNFAKIRNGLNLKGQASEPTGENGDIYYDSSLNKHRFFQNGVWVDGGSGSGLFNYVTNPDAASSAETGTTVTGSFTRTRGTTPATFSDTYFEVATGATAASSISWGMDTLQEKHDGQLMRFSARVKMPATTHTYTLELRTGASFAAGTVVPGTALTLTANANMKWESLFVLDTSLTYWVGIYRTSGTTNETIYVDDVTISPELTVAGQGAEPWKAFTPTGTWTTNTTYTGVMRRVGQNLEGRVRVTVSGAPSGTFSVTIPSSLTIDTAALPSGSSVHPVGTAMLIDASPSGNYAGNVYISTTTSLRIATSGASGTV